MTFAEGVPFKDGASVVGAIGVSGVSRSQNQAVADAGAAALET
jgi:uncharacterized protein GlcG (DUF336 family)